MFGKRRLTLISYFLAVAIFLLSASGDGPSLLKRLGGLISEAAEPLKPEITSVRTERILLEGSPWETVLYITASPNPGQTVMVIGGIHGNEPAGHLAAESIASWAVDSGTLIVLPRANNPAIADQNRTGPGGVDLNRVFPGAHQGEPTEMLAVAIFEVIKEFEPAWVIDLHEAENFERDLPGALGQTFIYPRGSKSLDIIQELLIAVNRTIYLEKDYFILLRGMASGGVIEAAQFAGAEAVIIETCMQMPSADRVKYHRQVVGSLLYLLGITVY